MKNLSTALAKFASLFDSFSKELTNMRSERGCLIEDPWKRFWGAKESSFDEELDKMLLGALEPYKKTLALLKEVRINRILSEAALTPQSKIEQAEAFKEKADIKLNELSEEIDILRERLAISNEDENEESLFESSRFVTNLSLGDDGSTGKFSVTETPFKRKEQGSSTHLDSETMRSPFSQGLTASSPEKINRGVSGKASDSMAGTPLDVGSSTIDKIGIVEELAGIEYDVIELRNFLEDKNDLRIKTADGVKALSLPFFVPPGADGYDRIILDLEGIVDLHNKAIRAVVETSAKSEDPGKIKPLLSRVQKYLLSMYGNIRTKVSISSENMPSTQGEISYDLFLQLEVCANLGQWESIEDINVFKDVFEESFSEPLSEYMKEPKNRLAYLKSIVNG